MMEENNFQNNFHNEEELDEVQTFTIEDEFGRTMTAELLTIVEIDDIEYAVYSIDANEEESDVYVARIVVDAEGNDTIVSIEDEEERAKVFEVVQKMISES